MAKSKRVTLTKSQVSSEMGVKLLRLLNDVTDDGEIDLEEVDQIRWWLRAHTSSTEGIYAVSWLLELVEDIVADGVVTDEERFELMLGIERVMPKAEREIARSRREAAGVHVPRSQRPIPATVRQVGFIEALGATVPPGLSKNDASDLIDQLMADGRKAPVTNRQMMVLRFWNKVDLADQGRVAVSDWMDDWYTENAERREAWEAWKFDARDNGQQSSPSIVPLGLGYQYLDEEPSATRHARNTGCFGITLLAFSAIAGLLAKIAR